MAHDVMTGMFWGGVAMMLPPVAASVGVAVYLYRRHRSEREGRAKGSTSGE